MRSARSRSLVKGVRRSWLTLRNMRVRFSIMVRRRVLILFRACARPTISIEPRSTKSSSPFSISAEPTAAEMRFNGSVTVHTAKSQIKVGEAMKAINL